MSSSAAALEPVKGIWTFEARHCQAKTMMSDRANATYPVIFSMEYTTNIIDDTRSFTYYISSQNLNDGGDIHPKVDIELNGKPFGTLIGKALGDTLVLDFPDNPQLLVLMASGAEFRFSAPNRKVALIFEDSSVALEKFAGCVAERQDRVSK
jgi:hypothetical protein